MESHTPEALQNLVPSTKHTDSYVSRNINGFKKKNPHRVVCSVRYVECLEDNFQLEDNNENVYQRNSMAHCGFGAGTWHSASIGRTVLSKPNAKSTAKAHCAGAKPGSASSPSLKRRNQRLPDKKPISAGGATHTVRGPRSTTTNVTSDTETERIVSIGGRLARV